MASAIPLDELTPSGLKSALRITPAKKLLRNREPFHRPQRPTRVTHLLLSLQDIFHRDVGAFMLNSRSSFKGQIAEQAQEGIAAAFASFIQQLRL